MPTAIMPTNKVFGSILGVSFLLLALQANAQNDVEGYNTPTLWSRIMPRSAGYAIFLSSTVSLYTCMMCHLILLQYPDIHIFYNTILYSTVEFPNAETCGKQECERFANNPNYRGFEYSVAQRCTCLFDRDEAPAVPNDESDPKYVTRTDNGIGTVAGKCSI